MEASKLSGLPESTLRYYETIGLIDPIRRDASSKHRVYDEDNINILISIACLSATGMSLKDMRTYLGNRGKGAQVANEQIDLLNAQRTRLMEEARYLKLRQRYVETKVSYWRAVAAGDDAEARAIAQYSKEIARELNVPKS